MKTIEKQITRCHTTIDRLLSDLENNRPVILPKKKVSPQSRPYSKAQRILAAITKHEGKTAAEIARAAKVDHNHVYIFQSLVEARQLTRVGDRGRGCTYVRGESFTGPKGFKLVIKPLTAPQLVNG